MCWITMRTDSTTGKVVKFDATITSRGMHLGNHVNENIRNRAYGLMFLRSEMTVFSSTAIATSTFSKLLPETPGKVEITMFLV